MMSGLVFNIQSFAIHDGPGIRTTVFLKGCNLRCFWCHNPESLHPFPEVQFFPPKCTACGQCFNICPVQAHEKIDNGHLFHRDLCIRCGKCTESCFSEALIMSGKERTVEDIMSLVEKDAPFHKSSGGGVTFSGGEPMLQLSFLKELLSECKKRGLHTAIDTAGHVPWASFQEVLPFLDLVLYDVKMINSDKHLAATGSDNRRILDNLEKLAGSDVEIWIHVPIIPGANDTPEDMREIASFLKPLNGNLAKVELLPFHKTGRNKYTSLGMNYKARDFIEPDDGLMARLSNVFREMGIPVAER